MNMQCVYRVVVLVSLVGVCSQGFAKRFKKMPKDQRKALNRKLFEEILQWNEKGVKELLAQGANPNAKGNGATPLHKAVELGLFDAVKLLVEHGADVNALDRFNATPLHRAAAVMGTEKIAPYLLEHGAAVNMTNKAGNTPLHTAVNKRLPRMALLLLEQEGIDVSIANRKRQTPLHLATRRKSGKLPTMTVQGRSTPMPGSNMEQVVKILIERNANLDAQDQRGNTALHFAVLQGRLAAVEQLIEHGAKVNVLNIRCKSPLDYALQRDQKVWVNQRIVFFLQTKGAWKGMGTKGRCFMQSR